MVGRLLLACLITAAVALLTPAAAVAQPPQPSDDTTQQQDSDLFAPCAHAGAAAGLLPSIFGELAGPAVQRSCQVGMAATNPGEAVAQAMDGAVGRAAEAFADGWGKGLTLMFSWWYRTPLTDELDSAGGAGTVETVHAYLRWLQIGVFVVSIGVSAVRLGMARAELIGQQAQEAAAVLTRTVFASWTLAGIVVMADNASRAAGLWILESLAGEDVAGLVAKLLSGMGLGPVLGAGLLFVFALVGILGTVVQCVFVLMQIAVAKLVQGVIPLAAAASGIEAGKQAYHKLLGWTAVFVLFPLFASIVYGVALAAVGGAGDAQSTLAGVVLLTLSCLTLPALLRLIVPAVGRMGGGSGAMALAGVTAATGAVAGRGLQSMGSVGNPESSVSSGEVTGGRSDGADTPSGAVAAGAPGPAGPAGAAGASGQTASAGASGAASAGVASGAAAAAGPVGAAAAVGAKAAGAVGATVSGVADAATAGPDTPDGAVRGGRST